jgi:hypothetical protein
MRTFRTAAIVGLVIAAPLAAQGHPQTREGLNVSFGFGEGSASVTCNVCVTDRNRAPTAYLRVGETLRPNLVVAGELDGWDRTKNGVEVTIITVNLVGQWFPQPANGFFLVGGAGLGLIDITAKIGTGKVSNSGHGLGVEIGAGYDWRVGKNFALTPFAALFTTSGLRFENGGKADGNVVHAGIGFTWP